MADEPDDIRSILQGAVDGTITADAPIPPPELTPETPIVETPGETAEQKRARDEAGRFAKETKPRETLALKPKVEPSAKPLTEQQPAAQAAKPLAPEIDKDGKHLERIAPPAGWKGSANLQWDRLPRPIREELARGYGEVESARAEMLPLKELFDVNREFLVNQAGSVPEAMRQMMTFARMSVDRPVELAQHILRARGIDPAAAFSGQPQAARQGQQADPQAFIAQAVQQQIAPLLAHLQQTQQQQTQATVREIEAFSADPAHPFFNDVANDIRFLLESDRIPPGPPLQRLQQAYDQATWMNPTIRPHLTAAQGEEEAKRKAAEVTAAQRALSASVTGSPVPGAASLNGTSNPNASIREDLLAAVRQHTGQV